MVWLKPEVADVSIDCREDVCAGLLERLRAGRSPGQLPGRRWALPELGLEDSPQES